MSPSRPRPPSLLACFAVWTAIALFSILQSALVRATSHQPSLPFSSAAVIAGNCWLWALYTPLIWRISERFPLDAGRRRAVLIHVAVLIVMIAVDGVFNARMLNPILKLPARPIVKVASDLLFIDALCYVVLVAIEHGRRYYGRAIRLESDLREARLQALEAQLRPHFLFNALNTVSSLIRTREDQAAIRAVRRAGRRAARSAPPDGARGGAARRARARGAVPGPGEGALWRRAPVQRGGGTGDGRGAGPLAPAAAAGRERAQARAGARRNRPRADTGPSVPAPTCASRCRTAEADRRAARTTESASPIPAPACTTCTATAAGWS